MIMTSSSQEMVASLRSGSVSALQGYSWEPTPLLPTRSAKVLVSRGAMYPAMAPDLSEIQVGEMAERRSIHTKILQKDPTAFHRRTTEESPSYHAQQSLRMRPLLGTMHMTCDPADIDPTKKFTKSIYSQEKLDAIRHSQAVMPTPTISSLGLKHSSSSPGWNTTSRSNISRSASRGTTKKRVSYEGDGNHAVTQSPYGQNSSEDQYRSNLRSPSPVPVHIRRAPNSRGHSPDSTPGNSPRDSLDILTGNPENCIGERNSSIADSMSTFLPKKTFSQKDLPLSLRETCTGRNSVMEEMGFPVAAYEEKIELSIECGDDEGGVTAALPDGDVDRRENHKLPSVWNSSELLPHGGTSLAGNTSQDTQIFTRASLQNQLSRTSYANFVDYCRGDIKPPAILLAESPSQAKNIERELCSAPENASFRKSKAWHKSYLTRKQDNEDLRKFTSQVLSYRDTQQRIVEEERKSIDDFERHLVLAKYGAPRPATSKGGGTLSQY